MIRSLNIALIFFTFSAFSLNAQTVEPRIIEPVRPSSQVPLPNALSRTPASTPHTSTLPAKEQGKASLNEIAKEPASMPATTSSISPSTKTGKETLLFAYPQPYTGFWYASKDDTCPSLAERAANKLTIQAKALLYKGKKCTLVKLNGQGQNNSNLDNALSCEEDGKLSLQQASIAMTNITNIPTQKLIISGTLTNGEAVSLRRCLN